MCLSTDLDQRYQTSYTAPCNGIISHRATIGGILVLPDYKICGNKHKQNAPMIFAQLHVLVCAPCGFSPVFMFTHETATPVILITGKLKYTQLEPMGVGEGGGAKIVPTSCISGLNLYPILHLVNAWDLKNIFIVHFSHKKLFEN